MLHELVIHNDITIHQFGTATYQESFKIVGLDTLTLIKVMQMCFGDWVLSSLSIAEDNAQNCFIEYQNTKQNALFKIIRNVCLYPTKVCFGKNQFDDYGTLLFEISKFKMYFSEINSRDIESIAKSKFIRNLHLRVENPKEFSSTIECCAIASVIFDMENIVEKKDTDILLANTLDIYNKHKERLSAIVRKGQDYKVEKEFSEILNVMLKRLNLSRDHDGRISGISYRCSE